MISGRKFKTSIFGMFMSLVLFQIGHWADGFAAQEARFAAEGIWQGELKISSTELRIVFQLQGGEKGEWTGQMDSPDQGAFGIPLSGVHIEGSHVRLEVGAVAGVFEGVYNPASGEIEGNWSQSGLSLPLILRKVARAPQLKRPQEPTRPYPYREEEVVFENLQAGIKLAGTLTLPEGNGPFPAAVLISGSGPQDRDETVFGHRPFLVLADYLTRRGVAVLRFDDRGVGKSGGDFSKATTEDFASDVFAALNYLKQRKDVDGTKMGLIGHSEGALIAPMVAAKSPDVAFIVLMAAPGLRGEELLLLQSERIARASGVAEETVQMNNAMSKQVFQILETEPDRNAAAEKIKKLIRESMSKLSAEEQQKLGYSEKLVDKQVEQLVSPWFLYFLKYDPVPVLRTVRCPVLAVNGALDLQVPPDENLPLLEQALKEGNNPDFMVQKLPGLNHLFQHAQSGLPGEYAKIEETIAPEALRLIGDWITDRVAR